MRQCLQGSPALITSIDLLNGTHARDNKSIHNLQGLVRLLGMSRVRSAGKIQPTALGRTNENIEIESEGDTWKAVLVEGKRVVSSLALSLPSGVTGKQRWTRARLSADWQAMPIRGVRPRSLDVVAGWLCEF